MNKTFYIIGAIIYFLGFVVLVTSRTVIHENVALMIFVNGTLFIVGGGIISAIVNNSKEIKVENETKSETLEYEIDKNSTSYVLDKEKKDKYAKYR